MFAIHSSSSDAHDWSEEPVVAPLYLKRPLVPVVLMLMTGAANPRWASNCPTLCVLNATSTYTCEGVSARILQQSQSDMPHHCAAKYQPELNRGVMPLRSICVYSLHSPQTNANVQRMSVSGLLVFAVVTWLLCKSKKPAPEFYVRPISTL